MALVELPAVCPSEQMIGYLSNSVVNRSAMTQSVQVVSRPGALLTSTIVWRSRNVTESNALKTFLMALEGPGNHTKIHDFTKPQPSGSLAGAPLVNGGGQTGYTLTIDGCQPGSTLVAGDCIGVAGRLHWVRFDAVAANTGGMTIQLCQPLIKAPADNELVQWDRPSAEMICVTPNPKIEMLSAGVIGELVLEFLERRV